MKVALSSCAFHADDHIRRNRHTGTGGAVAAAAIGAAPAVYARRQTAQVLVVTHLPQVAARGSQHLRVVKE